MSLTQFGSVIIDIKGEKTQKQLAADLGVSPSTISRWLKKPTMIRESSANALSKLLPSLSADRFSTIAHSSKQLEHEKTTRNKP